MECSAGFLNSPLLPPLYSCVVWEVQEVRRKREHCLPVRTSVRGVRVPWAWQVLKVDPDS